MNKSTSVGLKVRSASLSNSIVDKENEGQVGLPSGRGVKEINVLRPSDCGTGSIKTIPESEDGKTEKRIISWMTDSKVEDPEYWRKIAEERRLALQTALSENESLHGEMELLKDENEQLQAVVARLIERL